MLNILKSDSYRIIKGQLGLISLLGIMVLAIFFGSISSDGDVLETLVGGLSIGTMILPIFFTTIYMMTFGNEFSYRVINNSLISGIKRHTYYISKVLLTFIMTIIYVVAFALTLVLTLKVTTGDWMIAEASKIVMAQLPLYLGVSSIGILCFNLIKTPYIAVAAFISVAFVGDNLIGSIVETFLPKLDFMLETFIFTNLGTLVGITTLSTQTLTTIMISCFIYSVVIIVIGYQSIKIREFK